MPALCACACGGVGVCVHARTHAHMHAGMFWPSFIFIDVIKYPGGKGAALMRKDLFYLTVPCL